MGQIDTYRLPNIGVTIPVGSTINKVTVFAWCAITLVGGKFSIGVRTGGTNFFGTIHSPPDTVYRFISELHTTNPDTGVAWTRANINALEVAVELTSKRVGAENFGSWCTQIYAEVDFDPPAIVGSINRFNRTGQVPHDFG